MQSSGWFYEVGNERLGPVSLEVLQVLVRSGKVGRQTRVWAEGLPEPVPAGSFAALFAAPGPQADPALKYVLPVGRSGWAIAAGYLAIFGMFIPLFCFQALLCAAVGVSDIRKHPEKLGWGRIVFAFIVGGLWSIGHVIVIVAMAAAK
jgi:amino acid transporter